MCAPVCAGVDTRIWRAQSLQRSRLGIFLPRQPPAVCLTLPSSPVCVAPLRCLPSASWVLSPGRSEGWGTEMGGRRKDQSSLCGRRWVQRGGWLQPRPPAPGLQGQPGAPSLHHDALLLGWGLGSVVDRVWGRMASVCRVGSSVGSSALQEQQAAWRPGSVHVEPVSALRGYFTCSNSPGVRKRPGL